MRFKIIILKVFLKVKELTANNIQKGIYSQQEIIVQKTKTIMTETKLIQHKENI